MYDTIVVEILYRNSNLVCELLDPLFWHLEASELDVVEEILTLHILKHDIIIVLILKEINESNNIWMLTHFQNVNFSSLLVYLDWFHVFLVYRFDGNFLSSFFVDSKFYQTELTLSKVLLEIIVVEKIRISRNSFESIEPVILHLQ